MFTPQSKHIALAPAAAGKLARTLLAFSVTEIGGPSGSVVFCAGLKLTTTSSAQNAVQFGSCHNAARVVFAGVADTPRAR